MLFIAVRIGITKIVGFESVYEVLLVILISVNIEFYDCSIVDKPKVYVNYY